ncbi:MAG: ABC transporter permease, partial [Anaerolineae bacterium]
MLQRIWTVVQKEFIQTFRDRRTLLLQLSMPVIQLLLMGYGMDTNVTHIPLVVADQSRDSASLAYVSALEASGYFDVVAYVSDEAEVVQTIDEGGAQAGVVIPHNFVAQVERNDAQVLVLVDGSNLLISQSAYSMATIIAEAHATEVLMEDVARTGLLDDGQSLLPLEALVRILYNPNLEAIWFVVPGVCAM